MWKKFVFVTIFVCMMVIFTSPAYAYIDPSAVTYTAQAIAAVVVALTALVTVFRHKIVAFFKKNKGQNAKREIHVVDDETTDSVKEDHHEREM